MTQPISEVEAQDALSMIAQRRQQIVAEINVPAWYWFALAGGWIAIGLIEDLAAAWIAVAATLLFGAAHAAISPRVLTGRRGSRHLSVRSDLVGHEIPLAIIGLLIVMVGVTMATALLLHADGTRHAGTWASAFVAALLLTGGPTLMAAVRRRAARS